MPENDITIEGRTFQEVEESASVEEGLAVVKVELGTLGLTGREEVGNDLSFQAFGKGVVKLDLGVERVSGCPGLG